MQALNHVYILRLIKIFVRILRTNKKTGPPKQSCRLQLITAWTFWEHPALPF